MINKNNFIKQFKKGNEKSLDYIVNNYLKLVKSIVINILKDNEEAEECINDIFFSIWQNKDKFLGNYEIDFKKWIFKISKYKAIDYYRKNNKKAYLEITENLLIQEITPEDNIILLENENEILKILDNLKDIDKKIFIMKYFLDMKSKTIAKELNLSVSSVDNRIYRGKIFLKNMLGG